MCVVQAWENQLHSYTTQKRNGDFVTKKRLPIADWRLAIYKFRMRQDELKARTKTFALRVVKLIASLPKSIEAKAIANQLVRCGTAVGANYRATCRARSRAEFIAKIGIVEEESDESAFWLELIIETKLLTPARIQPLLDEANELVAIMAASHISACRNKSPIANRQSAI